MGWEVTMAHEVSDAVHTCWTEQSGGSDVMIIISN